MSSALPLAAVTIAYLAFVLKIGPALMKDSNPYDLKNTLLVYNAFQVGLSIYIVIKSLDYHINHGFVHSQCFADDKEMRKELFDLSYLYLFAKVTELLDTIFFVLRKKSNQVTFLHVYHHAIMVVSSWIMFKFFPHDNFVFVATINGLVHVFMYAYYGFAAVPSLSKYLWWKEYITMMQLVQFIALFLYYQISLYVTDCPPPKYIVAFVTVNNALFVYLFVKFYINNYRKNSGIKKQLKGNNLTIGNEYVTEKKIN